LCTFYSKSITYEKKNDILSGVQYNTHRVWYNRDMILFAIGPISHCHKYSLQVLAENVISLVLPLSVYTDASARVACASTHGENDLLADSREYIGEK